MTEPSKGVVLIVEDEPLKRVTLGIELSDAGYEVIEAADGRSALEQIASRPIHVVLSDLQLQSMDGLSLLEQIKANSPQTHVIIMTADGSVNMAVESLKRGAYDYLTKPIETDLLLKKLDRVLSACSRDDGAAVPKRESCGNMIGRSYATRRLFEQIRHLAGSDHHLLILGENGAGAASTAEAVHGLSSLSEKPMLKLDCAASGSERCDAALFDVAQGILRRADGGTLFLDNIDALPVDVQQKLLHTLESGATPSWNGQAGVPAKVRLITATSADVESLLRKGRFREELYYRLSAGSLTLPPLRNRLEDLPLLVELFMKRFGERQTQRPAPTRISPHAMDLLAAYTWPGNLRELEQVVARAVMMCEGTEVLPHHIALPSRKSSPGTKEPTLNGDRAGLAETLAGVEKTLIAHALRRAAGNQAKAAQYLKIPRTTLRDKMSKYGLVAPARDEPAEATNPG